MYGKQYEEYMYVYRCWGVKSLLFLNKHVIQIYNKFFSVEKFGSGKHVLINSYTCFAPVFIRRSCLIRRMMNFKSFAEHLKKNKDKKKTKRIYICICQRLEMHGCCISLKKKKLGNFNKDVKIN